MRTLTQPPRPFPLSYRLRRLSWSAVGRWTMYAALIFVALILTTHIAPQVFGFGNGWR